jgi:hypothetical protein
MTVDLTQFSGTLPYASELFGVYQPLLGWKSQRKKFHLSQDVFHLVQDAVDQIRRAGPSGADIRRNPSLVLSDDLRPQRLPNGLNTLGTRKVTSALARFKEANNRLPEGEEWATVVAEADLTSVVREVAASEVDGDGVMVRSAPFSLKPSAKQEAVVGGMWTTIAAKKPELMPSLIEVLSPALTSALLAAADPLAAFDPSSQLAVLSPLGLIHLYREYFFEFATFLGPPVGHVWVSPGGSLELYEVHTRRTLQERQTEIANEITTKSQTEASEEDELSTTVNEQNSRNLSFGATVSASGKIAGVLQASASTNFGMQFTHQTAEETAHKHSRKQSESLSNEIRRSFKTTFKTSVETTDTSSRRYVLSNTTDNLVNYELRRKMRQVGVQVQHISTQLCWETYVDVPGFGLGLANLVHVAVPEDLEIPDPPEKPARQPSKNSQYVAQFPFEGDDEGWDDNDELFTNGVSDDDGHITYHRQYPVEPPTNATGYTLGAAEVSSFAGVGSDDTPSAVATHCTLVDETTFELWLDQVNFEENTAINFTVDLIWDSPPVSAEANDAYKKKEAQYNAAGQQAAHAAFVKLVHERVKLASNIRPRPEKDLREEERTLIYRRLIASLNLVESQSSAKPLHLQSELLRAIFDIDKMLYFVAQEWWKPHYAPVSQQGVGDTTKLTDDDRVSWGGRPLFGADRPNYLITEDSEPVPFGASLGWMMQLDGDPHRNAFLNSPWVKAVIPIRPGRERAAINWLMQAQVEGTENLGATYAGGEPELAGKTIEQALKTLAEEVGALGTDMKNELATETVFENGFDPLEGGFKATGIPFEVFDQWIEILPTEQIVAVDYHPVI